MAERSTGIRSESKFRELVLLLATASEKDPRFSATKLNKLLFICDFASYRSAGESITGEAYQKLQYGPAPRRLLPLLKGLIEEGACVEVEREHFGKRQKRVFALRPPDVDVFSPRELYLVEQIVRDLWDASASEISDISHEFVGWKAAKLGEDIPYETVYVGDPEVALSQDEIDFCRALDQAS